LGKNTFDQLRKNLYQSGPNRVINGPFCSSNRGYFRAGARQRSFTKPSKYRGPEIESPQNVSRETFKMPFQNLPNREMLKCKKISPPELVVSGQLSFVGCL
jgi:hypothetical protein